MSDQPAVARVLVIEDEPLIQETFADMLDLGGHHITLADTGEDGVRMFKEGEFDVVFTDITLPGMSGWDVATAVKLMSEDTPVIAVTGWGAGINQSDIVNGAVDDVLPKPFDIDRVLELVESLMAAKRLNQKV